MLHHLTSWFTIWENIQVFVIQQSCSNFLAQSNIYFISLFAEMYFHAYYFCLLCFSFRILHDTENLPFLDVVWCNKLNDFLWNILLVLHLKIRERIHNGSPTEKDWWGWPTCMSVNWNLKTKLATIGTTKSVCAFSLCWQNRRSICLNKQQTQLLTIRLPQPSVSRCNI